MLSKVPLTSDVVYYKLPACESSRDIRFYWKNGRYQTRAMEEFLKNGVPVRHATFLQNRYYLFICNLGSDK